MPASTVEREFPRGIDDDELTPEEVEEFTSMIRHAKAHPEEQVTSTIYPDGRIVFHLPDGRDEPL